MRVSVFLPFSGSSFKKTFLLTLVGVWVASLDFGGIAYGRPGALPQLRTQVNYVPFKDGKGYACSKGGLVRLPSSAASIEAFTGFLTQHLIEPNGNLKPIYVQHLPSNLDVLRVRTLVKKRLFILSLLPLVVAANQQIAHERVILVAAWHEFQEGGELSLKTASALRVLFIKYQVDLPWLLGRSQSLRRVPGHHQVKRHSEYRVDSAKEEFAQQFKRLLSRVEGLPNSLVLAIAIHETGWGHSRFLKEGNSLFSQIGFKAQHHQIILPKVRITDSFGVRKYVTLQKAVSSFMLNINTNRQYRQLREIRARVGLNSKKLALGLSNYAVMANYPALIKRVMSDNNLQQYDAHTSLSSNCRALRVYFN